MAQNTKECGSWYHVSTWNDIIEKTDSISSFKGLDPNLPHARRFPLKRQERHDTKVIYILLKFVARHLFQAAETKEVSEASRIPALTLRYSRILH